jgi:hypothetical protein
MMYLHLGTGVIETIKVVGVITAHSKKPLLVEVIF